MRLLLCLVFLFSFISANAEGDCPVSKYEGSKYQKAMQFFTSLKSVEGLGYCPELVLPELEERVECGVWNSKKFRGYSYFFILPDHEKYGPQAHYFMIGEKTTQTVWVIGSQKKGDWFTTKVSSRVQVDVTDTTMSWEFKQGVHRIKTTLEKDQEGNLIRFQAKAYKRGWFNKDEKLVYDTLCEE